MEQLFLMTKPFGLGPRERQKPSRERKTVTVDHENKLFYNFCTWINSYRFADVDTIVSGLTWDFS